MHTIYEDVAVVTQQTQAAPGVVYDFASRMDRLPSWASGLAQGIEQRREEWFAQSPMGEVKVAMTPINPYGVLDHTVTLSHGSTVFNALRVTPHGSGGVLTFVLLRDPHVTQAQFEADITRVQQDLATLARLTEPSRHT